MTVLTDELATTSALQTLLDASVDAIVIINGHGLIETFNRAAEKLFGYTAAEVLDRNVSLLMSEPHRTRHDDYMGRYLTTGEAHIVGIGREVQARRKDGSEFPVWLAVGQIQDQRRDAQAPRFVGFLHDLTFRHQAADVERRSAQHQAEVDRLAAMTELAADIAHEVNQPLAAITNYAKACERLLGAPESELVAHCKDVRKALGQIAEQALRAGDSIRRLRELISSRGQTRVENT